MLVSEAWEKWTQTRPVLWEDASFQWHRWGEDRLVSGGPTCAWSWVSTGEVGFSHNLLPSQNCPGSPFSDLTVRGFISPVFPAILPGIQRTSWVLKKQSILSAQENFPFNPSLRRGEPQEWQGWEGSMDKGQAAGRAATGAYGRGGSLYFCPKRKGWSRRCGSNSGWA